LYEKWDLDTMITTAGAIPRNPFAGRMNSIPFETGGVSNHVKTHSD
jgi:hypothetical protein